MIVLIIMFLAIFHLGCIYAVQYHFTMIRLLMFKGNYSDGLLFYLRTLLSPNHHVQQATEKFRTQISDATWP